MARTNPNKGSNYERKICGRLSLWVSNFTKKDCFWRSAMSGGRATQLRKKEGKHQASAGDITCIDRLGMDLVELFVIELKHYKRLQLDVFLYEKKCPADINAWWIKLKKECGGSTRQPLLICRENHRMEWALTSAKGIEILRYAGKLKVWWTVPNKDLYAVRFNSILALPFEKLREYARLAAVGHPRPKLLEPLPRPKLKV